MSTNHLMIQNKNKTKAEGRLIYFGILRLEAGRTRSIS